VTDRYLTPVEAELTGKIDTKNATVGQAVTAKTTQTVRLANGTVLPRGTNLVGRVTEVQARLKGGSSSLLTLTFDRAEVKGSPSIAVRGAIRTLAPAVKGDDIMAMSDTAPALGGASTSGGVRGSGGIFEAPVRPAAQAKGASLGTATADSQGAAGQAAGAPVAGGGETVSPAPRATGLPGVMLSNAATGSESGTLTAVGKNIALESGTQITLGVIAR
jgi:hypothetical protein